MTACVKVTDVNSESVQNSPLHRRDTMRQHARHDNGLVL